MTKFPGGRLSAALSRHRNTSGPLNTKKPLNAPPETAELLYTTKEIKLPTAHVLNRQGEDKLSLIKCE